MNSIRRELTRELLVASLSLVGIGLAALYGLARTNAIREFDYLLYAKALAVGALTVHRNTGVHVPSLTDPFLGTTQGRDFFELWIRGGPRLGRSESLENADLPRRTGSFEHPIFFNLTLPTGNPGRAVGYLFVPKLSVMAHDPLPKVEIELVAASDRRDLERSLTGLLLMAIACGCVLMVGTPWVVRRVLRHGLRQLHDLGEQAGRIDAGSLGTRFALSDAPVEIRPIFIRLNDLLGRLEESFERERRLSADLAHELRTPVAELKGLAECLLKWPDARDASIDREFLAGAVHMEGIVARMLEMARGEERQLVVRAEQVAIDSLVRDTWRIFATRASAKRLRVGLATAPGAARTDPVLLVSILNNLFDNAVDYTPEQGCVRITVEPGPDGTTSIAVANSTAGLDPADVEHLFDRFWRKEAARVGGNHVGLGLSIARTFAEAMGWKLTATLDGDRQLVFLLAPAASIRPPPSARASARPGLDYLSMKGGRAMVADDDTPAIVR